MTDSDQWDEQLPFCISSSEGFRDLSSQIHSIIQTGDLSCLEFFMDFVSSIVPSKQYSATQRFNALYLLFKATEKGDASLLGKELIKNHEFLNFLSYSAQHDSAKKMALDERGRFFFTNSPSKSESTIGINFVRLCLECFILWQQVFKSQDFDVIHAYWTSLQKKTKIPTYFYYVGRDYNLSQNLATWNYFDSLPQLALENNPEEKPPQTPVKNPIVRPFEVTLIPMTRSGNDSKNDAGTQKMEKDVSHAILKEEKGQKLFSKIGKILQATKRIQTELRDLENKNLSKDKEETDEKLNVVKLELEDIATDNLNCDNILKGSMSAKYQSQKEVTGQKASPKNFANDLLKIQNEIARSNKSYSNSPKTPNRQNFPETTKKSSFKTFSSLFQDNEDLQTKKTLFHAARGIHDDAKSPQINSLSQTTPQKFRPGFSGTPTASTIPSSKNKSTLIAQDYAGLSKEQKVETGPDTEPSPKNIIEWIDQGPIGNTEEKIKTFRANKTKTMPIQTTEFSAPSWNRTNTIASSPRKILKFGLLPVNS